MWAGWDWGWADFIGHHLVRCVGVYCCGLSALSMCVCVICAVPSLPHRMSESIGTQEKDG